MRLFKSRSRPQSAWYNPLIMGKIGLPELLIILTIVVLIFGANKLPELGRGIGKGIKNFKDATKEGAEDKS
jgi:sec-independent protein translocase protein TatA